MVGDGDRWRAIFEVFASGVRREIIVALMETPPGGAVELPEAASPPGDDIDPERLRLNLIHNHLPRMAAEEFVEWDRDPFRVRRGPRFEEAAAVIEAIGTYRGLPGHLTEECYYLEEGDACS